MELSQTQATLERDLVKHISAPTTALIIVFSILLLVLYKETVGYLLHDWTQFQNGEYAHGFVVLGIVAFMVWGQRSILEQTAIRPSLSPIILVLGFSMTWMIGILLGIRFVESLSFFLLIPSIILVLAGRQFVTKLLYPILFLLVAFPVWEQFLPYLQSLAASLSHILLKITGTTVLREEAYLIVPAGKFLVAEGCSGLRYLLAAMTFGGFYIYLERLTQWRAVVFFAVVIIAAILSNAIRITTVIIAGNMTNMQHPWVHEHLMLGWYIFAGMLVLVFWLGNKLSAIEIEQDKKLTTYKGQLITRGAVKYTVLLPLLIIAMIAGPLLKNVLVARAEANMNYELQLTTPEGQGLWKATRYASATKISLNPVYSGADNIIDQHYFDGVETVRLYAALYQQQQQDKELINVHNYLFNEEHWQAMTTEVITPEGSVHNSDKKVLQVQLKNNAGQKKVIWYWYEVAGSTTTKPIMTKLLDLYGLFSGNNSASVVMIAMNSEAGVEQAQIVLGRFYSSMNGQIDSKLNIMKK